jgi:hypothetical protein
MPLEVWVVVPVSLDPLLYWVWLAGTQCMIEQRV